MARPEDPMVRVESLDPAAFGYLRLRFVRSLATSLGVLALAWFLGLMGSMLPTLLAEPDEEMSLLIRIFGVGMGWGACFVIGLPMLLVPITALGWVLDRLPRRLTGTLQAIVFGAGFGLFGFSAGAFALLLTGNVPWTDPEAPDFGSELGFFLFSLVGCALTWTALRASIWQALTSPEAFLAARGWRPPAWHPSQFWRYLGLPPFLARFGRLGVVVLALLYFVVAIVNTGVFGVFALPTAIVELDDVDSERFFDRAALLFGGLLLAQIVGVGRFVATRANRAATRIYQRVREWDARPPIVFLRDFDQDVHRQRARSRDLALYVPAEVARPRTMDELLFELASPYGPLIAIGDPRDPTPPLGAARVFVPGPGRAWQDVVRGLVGGARAVVVSPGDSQGVAWEFQLLAADPGKRPVIALANPALPADENLRWWSQLEPALATAPLPAGHTPVAAYRHPERGWTLLTASKPGLESHATGLTWALQALFGLEGS
jgi:hypothetical protein